MNFEDARVKFAELQKKMTAYQHALNLLHYDGVTTAPAGTAEGRGYTGGVLNEAIYELQNSTEAEEIMAVLRGHRSELSELEARELEMFDREKAAIANIPKEEYVAYKVMLNAAGTAWREAKANNSFETFAPYLEQIVASERRFAALNYPDKDPYEAMLNKYEYGLTMEKADAFFKAVRERLVPLIARVCAAAQPKDDFLKVSFPIWKQRIFSEYLMDVLGADRNHLAIGETEHPFTNSFNRKDVRITTHYHEHDFAASMFSVIHETGHALYILNGDDKYEYTCLAGGISMGIHESQSRLYENLIGRSEAFLSLILPKLKELFPEQLEGVSAREFYEAVNKSTPSLIRIHADELTYPLHIMVRYDLEKALMHGELEVKDLPQAWAAKMKEYLGIEVPSDTDGVLQDSHWSNAQIGYFPSYALGSAYGVQMWEKMKESFDPTQAVTENNIPAITAWLTDRIYRHDRMYDPTVVLEMAVEAPFDPEYYIDYLEKKYSDIYHL